MRHTVVPTLGRIGPAAREAVPTLIELLNQANYAQQHHTIVSLRSIGGGDPRTVVPAVLKAIRQERALMSSSALDLLGDLGPAAQDAVPFLLEEVRRGQWAFQPQAATALIRIAPEQARQEAEALAQKWVRGGSPYRVVAAGIVLRMDSQNKEALKALLAALKDRQEPQRYQAAYALGEAGAAAKEALPALREALRDRMPSVRVLAAAAVWRAASDTEAAVPVLVEVMKAGNNLSVRQQAAIKLAEIGPPARAAVPALREASEDADRYLRILAATALKKIDPDGR
jgi:HEAT repeat protein